MNAEFTTEVQFYRLSEALQPYFTALYATSVDCVPGVWVKDRLHPEWAALRFTEGPPPVACVGVGELLPQWPFVANGPTSQAIQFSVTRSRVWGLGLQPAGWSKFIGLPANQLSDRTVDGASHEAFALFRPIHEIVQGAGGDCDRIARGINDFLMQHVDRPVPQEAQIMACQQALRDADVANVAELGERLDINRRSLERLCGRYFGFPPKLLLRRQRFLRSLAQFMLHSAGSWSKALDWQYYDQAQFVRDFRAFMGTTPTDYADEAHPILEKVMAQRMADQGAAPETDLPTVLRYGSDPEAARE
jgi:AraC-like DNA-binding protein